jgi:hypothetical protein
MRPRSCSTVNEWYSFRSRGERNRQGEISNVEAMDQLRRPGNHQGRGHARRVRPLCARRHPASREPGDPRPRAGSFLVVRQLMARRVQERRRRPRHQGALPHLRLALGAVRVLRQPALDQGGEAGRGRGRLPRPDRFRELEPLRRAAEGGAGLCRGDHLGSACRRQILGAPAQAFQRAGAGRDRLFRGPDHGAAALAAHPQHRAPSDSRRPDASMAPGFESEEVLKRSKQATDYWAKSKAKTQAAE